jgi:hypothetical protein
MAMVSIGMLAVPADAATTCSHVFCYQFGAGSWAVSTFLTPTGGVTLQSPLLPPLPSLS